MSTSAALTCITCRCVFTEAGAHRAHYKCDWHRYNLKRKVAQLPPVASDLYEAKVREAAVGQLSAKEQARAASVDSASGGKARCTLCSKSFGSMETLRTHEESKKHKEMMVKQRGTDDHHGEHVLDSADVHMTTAADRAMDAPLPKEGHNLYIQPKTPMPLDIEQGDGSEWESEEEDMEKEVNELDAIPPTTCMFCTHTSASVEANLGHMHARHSFFVPDVQYVCDMEGLLTWMGYKIGCGHECLWCCRAKDHHSADGCRKHMADKGHCMLRHDADAMFVMQDFYDYSSSYPDATEENAEEELPEDGLIIERDYQLVLPSGAAIGHRSLCRYYRQRLRPLTSSSSDKTSRALQSRALAAKLIVQYRGGSGAVVPTHIQHEMVKRKARDQHYVHHVLSKHRTQMDRRANKKFIFRGREEN